MSNLILSSECEHKHTAYHKLPTITDLALYNDKYIKIRKEIIKFVKNCYLKCPDIKKVIDAQGYNFYENHFSVYKVYLLNNIFDFVRIVLSSGIYDKYDQMISDIVGLLILALPNMFCANINSVRHNTHHNTHQLKMDTIPLFYIYKIPDLDKNPKKFEIWNGYCSILKKEYKMQDSIHMMRICSLLDYKRFDYNYIIENKVKTTNKQKYIITMLKDKTHSNDVVNLICRHLYIICSIRQEYKNKN
jgi:hypothetical protein